MCRAPVPTAEMLRQEAWCWEGPRSGRVSWKRWEPTQREKCSPDRRTSLSEGATVWPKLGGDGSISLGDGSQRDPWEAGLAPGGGRD